jgi:hypothetical protein
MLQLVTLMNESNEDQVVSNNAESNQMESDQTVVHGNINRIKCVDFNLKFHLISYFRF